jgi:enoyl-CoA hydratase/carnithine racemase
MVAEAIAGETPGIRLVIEPPLARLVFDRPGKRNALTRAMWQAIPKLLARAHANPEVRMLVVMGASAEAFASGADIAEFFGVHADAATSRAYNREVRAAVDALYRFSRPTVAAIRGACVGGGTSLALACDLRLADDTAVFGVPPARLGLVYSLEDTARLVRAVGSSRAREMIFTARSVRADEARRIGLVNEVLAPEALDARVADVLDQIGSLSSFSLIEAKRVLHAIEDGQCTDDDASLERFDAAFFEEDFREGVSAFTGKRAAAFRWRYRPGQT